MNNQELELRVKEILNTKKITASDKKFRCGFPFSCRIQPLALEKIKAVR